MLGNHNLPSTKGKKKKRVGRGDASSGNYSGRGMKGQRSRSGGKGGLKLRGLKQSMMAVPKIRGFKSWNVKPETVNIKELDAKFDDGATVNPTELFAKGLIREAKADVKILGSGELKKKLTVSAHAVSASAKEAIEKAGGTFEVIVKNTERTKKKDRKDK